MPRKRRVRKERQRWPPASRRDLTSLQDLELESGPRRRGVTEFQTEARAREAWFSLRDDYLAEASPGLRPDGWWRWESSECRRILGWRDAGGYLDQRDVPLEDMTFKDGQWVYTGQDPEVRTFLPGQVIMLDGTRADMDPIVEEDVDYLRRLGLLRPDEEEKLAERRRKKEEWNQAWKRVPDLALERDDQAEGNGEWRDAS